MRRPSLLLVALAAAAALTHTAAAAAPAGLHVTDPTGDANGVNSQVLGLPLPSTSTTPASVKGADITGMDVVTLFKGTGKARKAAGFTLTVRFAGPVQQGVNVTVTADTSSPCGESSRLQFGYQDLGPSKTDLAVCQSAAPGGASTTVGATEVAADATSITWTVDNLFKPGTTLSPIEARTSVFVLGVFDEATTDKTFTYGK
jgi:hypothetical protein